MRPKIGVAVASVLGGLVALATPFTVSAALLWSLTASPLSVATGAATTFTLTASNLLLGRIECVVVDLPSNFNLTSVGMVGSTAGDSWLVRRVGNRVVAWTTSGGGRLELLDSVTFTASATALNAGSLAWPASAYDRADCTGTGSVLGVPPIVVVTGPAVTPSPVPTPPPTPTPPVATATPTYTATPPPLVPTPAPTRTPASTATPLPSTALPPSTVGPPGPPGLTPRPQPSSTPSPGASAPTSTDEPASGGAQPSNRLPGGSSGGPGTPADQGPASVQPVGLRVALDEPELELGLGPLGLLSGSPTWVVPVATLGGPGLIVLLWVAAQAGGASIWIPAARRLRGEERRETG